MEPGQARTSGLGVPPLLLARWVGWVAPVRLTHGVLVLSCSSAALRVHVCAVSWATWLLFTGVPAWCILLLVRCPEPTGSCSPVCPLGVLFCLCRVLGDLAPVQQCTRSVRCFACAVSWAAWPPFTGVPARCVALRVRCPGPLGPVHRCARLVRCFACAVFWATCPLFTGVSARCVACVCGVLNPLAPVHRCALLVGCVVCSVSLATWLLFTGVPARCVYLVVRCPGPLGSWSLVRPLGMLCCVCRVLGHLAPAQRCACSVRCFACAVS